MDDLYQDLRFGVKLLRKDRGFLAAALVTLALCIGANAAIFSVIHSVLLRPLPYARSDALVHVYNSYPNAGAARGASGVPDYFDRRAGVDALEESALLQQRGVTVGEAGSPERVQGMRVTPTFFPVLGATASVGRTFTAEEGEPGSARSVVLSHAMWRQSYGGRGDAVGSEIRIDGVPHTIVGVMPEGFGFLDHETRLWLPLAFTEQQKSDDERHNNNYTMIGLLRPGATVALAQAQVDAVNRANDERFPQFREILAAAGFRTIVTGYRQDLTRDVGETLYLLQGGVLLVLLIGCVNIANLVLVRSTVRAREWATRFALGADRWRMTRQLLTESLLLALAGGILGIAVGFLGMKGIVALGGAQLPRVAEIGMHPAVIAAAAGLALVAGLLFGTIPVLRLFRADLNTVFRQEGRGGTAGRGALAARSALVVAQVSLAFALLMGAALLLVSFSHKLRVEPGFDAEGVLTTSVSLPGARYPDGGAQRALLQAALERVRALPGVVEVGATSLIPFGGDQSNSVITPEGHQPQPGESPLSPVQSRVTPGYLEAMRIPLVRGRSFDARDTDGATPVVIVDEWLANRYWPGQDPIGRRLFQGVPEATPADQIVWRTIVGVTKEIRANALTGDEQVGHYYYPLYQETSGSFYLTIRTAGDPLGVVGAVRAAINAIDPDLPVYGVMTMSDRVAGSLLADRARMLLLTIFAGVALLLAAVGIYGVLAYSVALRTREIGVRVALGSRAPEIFRLVLGQGLRLLGVGLALGVAGSLALTRVLRGMLYGVGPNDPLVFLAVLAVLAAVAAVACAVPARRAMRVDPMAALTYE